MNFVMQWVKNSAVIVLAVAKISPENRISMTKTGKIHLKLTCQLANFVGRGGEVHQNADEVEQQQEEVRARVNFPNEDGPGDVAENEVPETLHEADVWQEIGNKALVLWLLDLHLGRKNGGS
jgi:hypothetical protein